MISIEFISTDHHWRFFAVPTWVTHLIIADNVIKQLSELDTCGFCVGNIAPDCNVENEDRTRFTLSRKVTHWMSGEIKVASDYDSFYLEYILKNKAKIQSQEHLSFILGYYAHLITDAAYQLFIRNGKRVKDTWDRINNNLHLSERTKWKYCKKNRSNGVFIGARRGSYKSYILLKRRI